MCGQHLDSLQCIHSQYIWDLSFSHSKFTSNDSSSSYPAVTRPLLDIGVPHRTQVAELEEAFIRRELYLQWHSSSQLWLSVLTLLAPLNNVFKTIQQITIPGPEGAVAFSHYFRMREVHITGVFILWNNPRASFMHESTSYDFWGFIVNWVHSVFRWRFLCYSCFELWRSGFDTRKISTDWSSRKIILIVKSGDGNQNLVR